MATRPGHRGILGSERPRARGAELVAPLDGAERLAFMILLRPRPGSPELYPAGHWQSTLPPARGCLSAEEFAAACRAAEGNRGR